MPKDTTIEGVIESFDVRFNSRFLLGTMEPEAKDALVKEMTNFLRTALSAQKEEIGREIVEALEKAKSNLPGKYAIYYDGFLEGKSKAQSIVSSITSNK